MTTAVKRRISAMAKGTVQGSAGADEGKDGRGGSEESARSQEVVIGEDWCDSVILRTTLPLKIHATLSSRLFCGGAHSLLSLTLPSSSRPVTPLR